MTMSTFSIFVLFAGITAVLLLKNSSQCFQKSFMPLQFSTPDLPVIASYALLISKPQTVGHPCLEMFTRVAPNNGGTILFPRFAV